MVTSLTETSSSSLCGVGDGIIVALLGGEAITTMGGIAPCSSAGSDGGGGGGRRGMMGLDRFTEDQLNLKK